MKTIQEISIRKTAVMLNIPESLVELVISHKNKAMYEALYLHTSIEDSGLGKFLVRPKKVLKRIKVLDLIIEACYKRLETDLTDKQREKYTANIANCIEQKRYLESKI